MPAIGDRLQARYTVERVVAEGGMARVYLAIDERFGRPVAVKSMAVQADGAERALVEQMFQDEARLLSGLDHPGLVPVYDYFVEGSSHCLVMAYIDGRTLQAVLDEKGGPLPFPEVVRWMDELAEVSEYLHGKKPPIVFRDLKPSNVMLDANGRVRLIDFGIAEKLGHERATLFAAAGTPGYAPVEQYGGQVDARADVYALGATAYALLTGRVPPMAIDLLIGEGAFVPPRELNGDLPAELDKVLLKMMALYREDRYQSMTDVRRALRRVVDTRPPRAEPERARPPAQVRQSAPAAQPPPPRSDFLKTAVGVLVVVGEGRGRELAQHVQSLVRALATPIPLQVVTAPAGARLEAVTRGAVPFLGVVGWAGGDDLMAVYQVADLQQDALLAAQLAVSRAQALARAWPPDGVADRLVNPQDGSHLLLVPGGPTLMGDGAHRHRVSVSSFYLGQHPVTNRQYRRFLHATGRPAPDRWATYAERFGEEVPAAQLTWHDALEYAGWAGLRLPTGAEWEKAAGGSDGRRWPWGEEFSPDRCRTGVGVSPEDRGPVPIGSHADGASPCGCEDMVGNVWEWCSSRFWPYPYAGTDGREDPGGVEPREIRGGSWVNAQVTTLGLSVREGLRPDRAYDYVGFRLAADG